MSGYLDSLFSLRGKTALVTGGSRGIGEMIAEALLRAGARVYIVARKAEVCTETAARLAQHGECQPLVGDIANLEGIRALKAELEEREQRLDILVNNAGKVWAAPVDTFSEKSWDVVMDLNVKAPFFLTQALLPLLEAHATEDSPSQVINIGSTAGIRGNTGAFSYGPSKAAIHQLTKVLADELAPRHIHVNAIAPGFFPSQLSASYSEDEGAEKALLATIPARRMGSPRDIAGLVIAMAGNRYLMGAVVPIDGGLLLV